MTKEVKLVCEYNQVRTKDNFPGYRQCRRPSERYENEIRENNGMPFLTLEKIALNRKKFQDCFGQEVSHRSLRNYTTNDDDDDNDDDEVLELNRILSAKLNAKCQLSDYYLTRLTGKKISNVSNIQ